MRIGIGGPIVAAVLGLLIFPACSKHTAAVAPTATPAAASVTPGTAAKPTARRVAAAPARSTPAAAHPKASVTPTRRAAATPAGRAAPSTPHLAAAPARRSPTAAPIAATRQPTTAPRQPTAAPHTPVAATKAPASTVAVTGELVEGKRLYMQDCSTCHGARGQGSIGPSLQNEASRMNLSQAVAWIKNPKPPMPKLYPGSLNEEQVLDIATYVESIK